MEDVPELEKVRGELDEVSRKPEAFSEVRRKRKRSKVTDMDTEDGGGEAEHVSGDNQALTEAPAKRPVFPPVDASTTVVRELVESCMMMTSSTNCTCVAYSSLNI